MLSMLEADRPVPMADPAPLRPVPDPALPPLHVVVIHETNGRKYFEALLYLERTGRIASIEFYEASVIWKFVHAIRRERKTIGAASSQALRNLRFRLDSRSVRDRVVLMGVAPWDYRLLLFSRLRLGSRFIYHTSWPRWEGTVPKNSGPLTVLLRRMWLQLLRNPGVTVAAATGRSGTSAAMTIGGSGTPKPVTLIRHVVSDVFFERRASHAAPFRLLFLGELSEKKGLPDLVKVMDLLADLDVGLDIVGDGPLRDMAAALATRPNCTWHGHVANRTRLAEIVGGCHLLMSLTVRTGTWEELFGISLVEAAASGVPSIASDHIGPVSIITPGVDGIILPEHAPAEAAGHVRRLIDDPAAWTAMSAAAAIAARPYGLQQTAARWEQLLRAHMMAANGSRP